MTWSSSDAARLVESLGYHYVRSRGHDIYEKPGETMHVSIPRDRKELASGTLASIFRRAGTTKAEAERFKNGRRSDRDKK